MPHFLLFLAWFFFLVILLNINIIRFYFKANNNTIKKITLFIFFAFFLAYIGAYDWIQTLSYLPSLGRPVGFVFLVIWIAFFGYILLEYRIWKVRFIAHQTAYYISFSISIMLAFSLLFWILMHALQKNVSIHALVLNRNGATFY
jgi:hypothetical protein